MSVREKGRKKTKQETSTQYKVTDPISMADLEHIYLRKGRSYPSKPPPMSTKTWEEVRREKEERILKARRERAQSTPLETTSTDAMNMEEAQEVSKEIAEKAAERELKKQNYAQYQRTKQTADYRVPKTEPIPVPDLTNPRQKKEGQPPSALSNFDVFQYEEILGYSNKWQLGMWSASATPRLSNKRSQVEKAKPRIPSGNITAFQDYMPAIMSALGNPWKPLNKGTTTPSWTTVPPLVFLSTPGTPISRPQTGEELEEEQIKMNFSTVDKTVLIPEGREGVEDATSPIKFTRELQNGATLKVKPQGQSLLQTLGFEAQDKGAPDPDFYMPYGQSKRLSETYQMYTTERTPKDNPGVLVKLPNLEKKYGTSMFLMDRRSRHLYIAGLEGYEQIDEKGLLFPSESMIVVGALGEDKGEPVPFIPDSEIQGTPAAESTRVPLKASTRKRETMKQKEPLTPNQLLEMEQTNLYKKELQEAEEDMVQAYLEKSRLEKEEAEIIRQRALEAQKEFEALEQKKDENRKINEKMREKSKRWNRQWLVLPLL